MRSDAIGCVWKRSDAIGRVWKLSDSFFCFFLICLDILYVFGDVRTFSEEGDGQVVTTAQVVMLVTE